MWRCIRLSAITNSCVRRQYICDTCTEKYRSASAKLGEIFRDRTKGRYARGSELERVCVTWMASDPRSHKYLPHMCGAAFFFSVGWRWRADFRFGYRWGDECPAFIADNGHIAVDKAVCAEMRPLFNQHMRPHSYSRLLLER